MESYFFVLISSFLLTLTSCQNIVQIQTKTSTAEDAGLTTGQIDLHIINNLFDDCQIFGLDASGNDFKPGEIDLFMGADIGPCLNFYVPDHEIPIMVVSHHGLDAWQPEWINVVLDDNYYVLCNNTNSVAIDNSASFEPDCQSPMKLSKVNS